MSLKPKKIKKPKTPAKAKVGDFGVEIHSRDDEGFPEHDVVVTRGRKKETVLEDEPDLKEAFEVWEDYLASGTSKFKSGIKPFDATKNEALVLKSLKDVFKKHKGASGWISANKLSAELSKKLRIKEAINDSTTMIIKRLDNEGQINVQYRAGLPLHGQGLGGDPNQRLIKIDFD